MTPACWKTSRTSLMPGGFPIWKAGIKNLLYHADVLDRKNKAQHTVARISQFGAVSPAQARGQKQVTEQAYARTSFTEDMARAVAQKLRQDKRIIWF